MVKELKQSIRYLERYEYNHRFDSCGEGRDLADAIRFVLDFHVEKDKDCVALSEKVNEFKTICENFVKEVKSIASKETT